MVSAEPEIQTLKVGQKGVFDESLLLACDRLWDVMEVDDDVTVGGRVLFEKHWTARKAVRLALFVVSIFTMSLLKFLHELVPIILILYQLLHF